MSRGFLFVEDYFDFVLFLVADECWAVLGVILLLGRE
jgi:hypothetical protein